MAEENVEIKVISNTAGFAGKMQSAAADVEKVGKAAEATASKMSLFTGALKKMATGMAMGVGMGMVNSLQSAILNIPAALGGAAQSASDLGETINMMSVVMGTGAAATLKWAENANTTLAMTQNQALRAAGTFAAFGKSAGKSGEELKRFATDLVGLATDLASFHNTTPEEAITAIGAALRGESEPIRRYQILLDDATLRQTALRMGIVATTTQALTPQQRVLAATAEIFRQSTDAQGDFGRTSGALAGQQRILAATMGQLGTTIGTGFLPAMTDLTTAANEFAVGAMPNIKAWAEDISTGFADASKNIAILVAAYDTLNRVTSGGGDKGGALAADVTGSYAKTTGSAMELLFNSAMQALNDWTQATDYARPFNEKLAEDLYGLDPAAAAAAAGLTTAATATATMGQDLATVTSILPGTAAGVADLQAKLIGLATASDTTGAALRSAFIGATTLLGVDAAVKGLTQANVEIARLRGRWIADGKTVTQIQFLEADYIAKTNQKLADQRQALADAERAATSYASNGVKSISSAYDDLAGKVSGVVGSLTSLSEIGGGPAATGDAANENAKRMAAIANEGIIGQTWLDDFAKEMPTLYAQVMASTDPKGFATTWVQDFQAGLHPEGLDREMIKTNIRRMILGEETMAAYVAEISAEIRAENGLAPAAAAIVDGVTGALGSQNMGASVGAATVASVNTPAAVVQFQNAGESAFGSWRTGWEAAADGWNPNPPGGTQGPSQNPAGGVGTTYGGLTQQPNVTINNYGVAGNPDAYGQSSQKGVLTALHARGK